MSNELTLSSAIKELGINKKEVFSHKIYSDKVVIVTIAGQKIIYIPGKEPKPMEIQKVEEQKEGK